ncbi:NUDIX hydrolase [Guggenheimella bovis]
MDLLKSLEGYRKRYTEESALVERFLSFINENPLYWSRSTLKGHLTASAWVVNESNEVLLLHHKKLGKWLQVGGHIEEGENAFDAAKRELLEEAGIEGEGTDVIFDIDIHEIPENKGVPAHYHYDIRFLLKAKENDLILSDESYAIRWVKVEDVPTITTEESVLRMVRKMTSF